MVFNTRQSNARVFMVTYEFTPAEGGERISVIWWRWEREDLGLSPPRHTSGWETEPCINLHTSFICSKSCSLGERAVIFRTRLSNLINDSYCHFFPPESTFPDPSHLSLGPRLTKHRWAARVSVAGGRSRPMTTTSAGGDAHRV